MKNTIESKALASSSVDRLWRMMFRFVCRPPEAEKAEDPEAYFQWRYGQAAETFFDRLPTRINFANKTVLDFGCGYGNTSIWLAQHGAAKVVGIDIDTEHVEWARQKLARSYPELSDRVSFQDVDGQTGQYDFIVSEDCFEHYMEPEKIMGMMRSLLAPDGRVLIGFSPLWKSPSGGHIGYMTKWPWAHQIFPEHIIMEERRRYRPNENARTFGEMRGGLSRMTYARFLKVMADTGFEIEAMRSNVSTSPLRVVADMFRRMPGLFEYFTKNIYAIVRPRRAVAGT